jgi:hypothetical protein
MTARDLIHTTIHISSRLAERGIKRMRWNQKNYKEDKKLFGMKWVDLYLRKGIQRKE